MRGRSGMAVLAIWLGVASAAALGQSQSGPRMSVTNRVNLQLQISGLGREGCEIEVVPGHPGCRFESVRRTVESVGVGAVVRLDTIPIEATSTGADRDCSFKITIREPGQPPRTFLRGLRLSGGGGARPQTLRCYLSTASLAARDAEARRSR
ncbi:MAG: hypothetical protein KatS3mg108_3442 [Isosphaeraceae bacterium]|nr:MAG: hypothetical protein KatS3mg108_3442 [Isosphaeraceae bacterium]